MKNLFFLMAVLCIIGCNKDDDPLLVKVIPDPYTLTFTTLTCDKTVDPNCLSDASKSVASDVEILLFETEAARTAGEPIYRQGKSDQMGSIAFTELNAQVYYYRAVHPTPMVVTDETISNSFEITPNTFNFFEEILFTEE